MTETVMGCRLKLVGTRALYKDGPCVYLSNHRAWADFFIDMYLTEGRAFILSRFAVAYVFPAFMLPAMWVGAVFAFKRGKAGAHDELNNALDAHLKTFTDFTGFVVYPEGTRNVRPKSLPLKRGLIKYTHSRGMDVQIIIGGHKEHVLSEQRGSASWGVEIPVGYSDVISSKAFVGDFEGFYAEVKRAWELEWDRVYGEKDRPTRQYHPKVQLVEYTNGMSVLLVASSALCSVAGIFAVLWCVTLAAAAMPLGVALGAARGA